MGSIAIAGTSSAAGHPPAKSNLDFYVATTGSDSNPGTIAQPFATIQFALTEAARFDYQNLYFPTVHVADGTYNTIAPNFLFELPAMTNIGASANPFLVGNMTTPDNCIIHDPAGVGCFLGIGSQSYWVVQGFQLSTDGYAIKGKQGTAVGLNKCTFNSTFAGNFSLFKGQQDSTLNINATTIVFNQASNFNIADMDPTARIFLQNSTIVLQVGSTWSGSGDTVFEGSQYIFLNNVITNKATSSGGAITLRGESVLVTDNGQVTDLFYTGPIAGDTSSSFVGRQNNKGGFFINRKAGVPTTSDVGLNVQALFKDTNLGGVTTVYNDGGTLRTLNRIRLTAATSFFVSLSGSDTTGDGSAGKPWASYQFAANYIAQNYDIGRQNVRIIATAGTGGSPNNYGGVLVPSFVGGGTVSFETSDGVPANTFILGGSGAAIQSNSNTSSDTFIAFGGMTLQCDTVTGTNVVIMRGRFNYGLGTTNCPNVQFNHCGDGSYIILVDDFCSVIDTIVACHVTINPQATNCNGFVRCQGDTYAILVNNNYVISGNPAWLTGFISAAEQGVMVHNFGVGGAITGASTGPSYLVEHGGVLLHDVAVATMPGNLPGVTVNGFNVRGSDTPRESMELLSQAPYAVGSLPAAGSWVCSRAMVNDGAAAQSFGAIVAAGGTTVYPVYSDGTNWRVG